MATRFLFRVLKNLDPQAQYNAIEHKDPFTLYFLTNGTGYLGDIKIFDSDIFRRIDDLSTIKTLVTNMLDENFVPDDVSAASTKAIVEYVKKQIKSVTDIIPDDTETLNQLANAIKEVKNSIPAVPDKLPADGGNADTVGGKYASDFANADHKHNEYALSEHEHKEYAAKEHDHTEYASTKHNHEDYALKEHEHEGYATEDHVHNEYASTEHSHNDYASKDHNHEGYAAEEHKHNEYALAEHEHDDYALANDIVPKTRTINNKALSDDIILTHEDVGADQSGTAEEKANKALEDAKAYTDEKIANINIPTPDSPQTEITLAQLGITASAEELNYTKGITSNIQEQLNNKASEKHTHSTDDVTGLSDVAKSGAYKDLIGAPEIPVIPEALPANGGNADTIDGKHASDFAEANHEHADYASKEHEHTEFAPISHEHIEYALKDDVSDDIDAVNKVIQQVNSNVESNTDAITTLNGQGDGSIDKKITDAFNKFINEGSNDNTINTFKELLDYAADHDSDIQTLIGEITKNRNNLSDLTTILEAHKNNKENPHNVTLGQLGVDALAAELNFIKGAKSNVQEQLDDKAQKDHSHDISLTYEDVGADPSGAAASALEEAKKYTDELIAQQPQAQVQIITWEDDD